jgi:hypothetical protein
LLFVFLAPAHLAVLNDDLEIVEMFLDSPDVNICIGGPSGNDLWGLALLEKRFSAMAMMMDRPEVNINAFLIGRGTALGAAVLDGDVDFTRRLLENKRVEIRGIGPGGEDLVALAMESSSLAICTMVLERYNQELPPPE